MLYLIYCLFKAIALKDRRMRLFILIIIFKSIKIINNIMILQFKLFYSINVPINKHAFQLFLYKAFQKTLHD
jgi:hypothetical protein